MVMHDHHRPQLRAAVRLRERYVKASQSLRTIRTDHRQRLDFLLETAESTAERLTHALDRGWTTAADYLRREYLSSLRDIGPAVQSLIEDAEHTPEPIPSLRDLFEELLAVEEDFNTLSIDHKAGTIAVLTDAIELEDVDLGRFSIELSYRAIGDLSHDRWFKAITQDPRSPSHDSSITHPHVCDDRVCTGDASVPIRIALTTGRLSEFFMLVRSVLQTYNADSAYVRLDDWDGVSCADCGELANPNDLCFCDGCEQDHCEDCIRCCVDCSQSGCRSCLKRSELTQEWVCSSCEASCNDCGKFCAASELTDRGLCDDCQAEADAREEEEDDVEQAEPAPAAAPQEVAHAA
jgi:hypothetical protein